MTDAPPRQVESLLKTVAGRSFTSRPSLYRPGRAPSIYLLAHNELDQIAREQIGQAALVGYGERLHD